MNPPIHDERLNMPSRIAAICVEKGYPADAVLAEVSDKLVRRGFSVAGFLQQEDDANDSACCSDLFLKDISSDTRFRITQTRGSGAQGCKLDPAGLAEAAHYMCGQIGEGVDLLILNRFGKGEEDGGGFRPVIEAAFVKNIPIIILVRQSYLNAWREFTDGDCFFLRADIGDILTWFGSLDRKTLAAELA